MKDNNYIFWNIVELNNWRLIVQDQWDTLQKSGILNHIKKIYIVFLGQDIKFIDGLLKVDKKNVLHKHDSSLHHFERLCLNSLLDWSQTNNGNILYMHTKGVSRPHNEYVWGWRKLMEHYLITNFQNCLVKLDDGYDAVGNILINIGIPNQKIHDENYYFHFSGNFWWSKTEYIKNLYPIPENIDLYQSYQYWLCERWILQKWPEVKTYEIYKSQHSHYYDRYPINVRKISDGDWQKGILPEYQID